MIFVMPPFMVHKGLTMERWTKFSLCEQLANVGCDIDRAIRWRDKGDLVASRQAFDRALELLSITLLDPKYHGQKRMRELYRTRELLIDYFVYDNVYKTTDQIWTNYFWAFSYAAAKQRANRQLFDKSV